MFGGSKKSDNRSSLSNSSNPSTLNTLQNGTTIKGDIQADGDIRIDGVLDGDLVSKAKFIIGPTGIVNGTAVCRTAVIEGKFDGNLQVADLLEVRDTANIQGEVTYGKLKIDPGAGFEGKVVQKKAGKVPASKA